MAWATIATDPVFDARMAAEVIRPAVFVYLDWPTGIVRATTHHQTVQTTDATTSPASTVTWTGVGLVARIEAPEFKRNGAQVTYKLGYAGLPQGVVDDDTQAAAIGRRAEIYLGLFDASWSDPVLKRIFIGHVITTGDFIHRRDESGNWVTDASIEVSNGRSPRRSIKNHHSVETAASGDTAMRLLPTVGKALKWPA